MAHPVSAAAVFFVAALRRRERPRVIAGETTADEGLAAGEPRYTLTLKNDLWAPDRRAIPANTRIMITLRNLDPTPELFESGEPCLGKCLASGGVTVLHRGPPAPGRCRFFSASRTMFDEIAVK